MTKLPTLGILFLTTVRAVIVAKLVILVISPLTTFILALRAALVAKLVRALTRPERWSTLFSPLALISQLCLN